MDAIDKFIRKAKALSPKTSSDIKAVFPDADTISSHVYIFNIKSDRMLCEVEFDGNVMLIKWVGSHDEYTRRFSLKSDILKYVKKH